MPSASVTRVLTVFLLLIPLWPHSAPAARQAADAQPPREFPEFRGRWTHVDSAGKGHIAGLPIARALVIDTTATELRVSKDYRRATP